MMYVCVCVCVCVCVWNLVKSVCVHASEGGVHGTDNTNGNIVT